MNERRATWSPGCGWGYNSVVVEKGRNNLAKKRRMEGNIELAMLARCWGEQSDRKGNWEMKMDVGRECTAKRRGRCQEMQNKQGEGSG